MTLVKPIPIQNASVTYGAEYFWRILDDLFSEGTIDSSQLSVQAKGTPDMSVDVLLGQAYIEFDTPDKGKKMVWNDATNNSGTPGSPGADWLTTFTAAHGSLPRIDRVVLTLRDNNLDASGAYDAKFQVVAGTATSGATLSNLTGAAAVPANSILLANVLVPAGSTTVTNTNIDTTSGTVRPLARIGSGTASPPATSDWVTAPGTWTYSSVDGPTGIVSVNADMTGVLQVGTRVKLVQSATSKYFIVTAVGTFSGGNTLITLLSSMTSGTADSSGLVNSAISGQMYSNMKCPFGFPVDPARWMIRTSDTSDRSQASPASGTWYNLGALSISVPIGCWNLYFKANLKYGASGGGGDVIGAFSTSASSASDSDLIGRGAYDDININDGRSEIAVRKYVTLGAKTSYFGVAKRTSGSVSSIAFLGSTDGATVLEAVCAYL